MIWSLIPLKGWAMLGIAIAASIALGVIYYKIDAGGYDRCQAEYKDALEKLKEESRKNIIESGKKYDKLNKEISAIEGENPIAGARVTFAIDSLPNPLPDSK